MNSPETEVKDRIFAALVYLLPLIYALPFGLLLLKQFPFLGIIYAPIAPLISIYYGLPFAGLIIFFALWFAVVRNQNINYFIRFNTMQVIMLDILLIVCNLIMNVLSTGFGAQSLITETLNNTIFIGTVVLAFYGIIQSARGFYAEIPALSEAVSSQIR